MMCKKQLAIIFVLILGNCFLAACKDSGLSGRNTGTSRNRSPSGRTSTTRTSEARTSTNRTSTTRTSEARTSTNHTSTARTSTARTSTARTSTARTSTTRTSETRTAGAQVSSSCVSPTFCAGGYCVKVAGKKAVVCRKGTIHHVFRFDAPIVRSYPNPRYPLAAFFTNTNKRLEAYEHTSLFFAFLDSRKTAELMRKSDESDPYGHYRHAPIRNALTSKFWSPDGKWAALLYSHYGPIDVVKTSALREYLNNSGKPMKKVKGRKLNYKRVYGNYRTSRKCFAHVYTFVSWKSSRVIRLWDGGCGSGWTGTYDIYKGRHLSRRCSDGYCKKRRQKPR